MITLLGALVVVGVLVLARYGSDVRREGEVLDGDAGWRAERPGAVALAHRMMRAHRRAWACYDASLRPWATTPAPRAGR